MHENIATRMKGCDLIVHCPWLSFIWMCEFVLCLYVCNAEERGSSSFVTCKKQSELARFVLVFSEPYGTALYVICSFSPLDKICLCFLPVL